MTAPRPLPTLDEDNHEWWEALRQHRLVFQRCAGCGCWRHPPRPACPHCRSLGWTWVESRGTGTIYAYTVIYRPAHPYFADKVPYNVILVELDEGVRLVSNLVPHDERYLRVGQRVRVFYDDVSEECTLPLFCPLE